MDLTYILHLNTVISLPDILLIYQPVEVLKLVQIFVAL